MIKKALVIAAGVFAVLALFSVDVLSLGTTRELALGLGLICLAVLL